MLGHLDGASKKLFGENFFGTNPSLGVDPAVDGFGSVRFRAEVPGSDGINPHDHSYYYHRGSEAPYGMADIVSGHGDQLQADGMTAEQRHSFGGVQVRIPALPPVTIGPHTPAVIDPEWERSPGSITDNHVFDAQHHRCRRHADRRRSSATSVVGRHPTDAGDRTLSIHNRYSHGEGSESVDVLDAGVIHTQVRRCMAFFKFADPEHFVRMCKAKERIQALFRDLVTGLLAARAVHLNGYSAGYSQMFVWFNSW